MNLLLAAFLLPLVPGADTKPRLDEKVLQAELEKALVKHDVPALGAAIVTSKGLEALAVAGVRKRGSKVKATKEDRFHLGSDTKAMTATLVALLIEKKLLAYDRTMEQAFPELAKKMHPDFKKVTLAQLLTHRAGLPADLEIATWERPSKTPIRKQREESVAVALAAKPKYEPGTKFEYSNVGYVLAGAMAERVGKDTWEALTRKQVFEPLKMKSAAYGPMASRGKIDQPWSHTDDGKPVDPFSTTLLPDNTPVMGPAGRVNCTLGDWAKFVADQLKGAQGGDGLLSAAAYRKMHAPASKGESYTPGGWGVSLHGDEPVTLLHDGSNGMNYATAVLFLKNDTAVLVVCNQGGPEGKPGQKACQQVREALVGLLKGEK